MHRTQISVTEGEWRRNDLNTEHELMSQGKNGVPCSATILVTQVGEGVDLRDAVEGKIGCAVSLGAHDPITATYAARSLVHAALSAVSSLKKNVADNEAIFDNRPQMRAFSDGLLDTCIETLDEATDVFIKMDTKLVKLMTSAMYNEALHEEEMEGSE